MRSNYTLKFLFENILRSVWQTHMPRHLRRNYTLEVPMWEYPKKCKRLATMRSNYTLEIPIKLIANCSEEIRPILATRFSHVEILLRNIVKAFDSIQHRIFINWGKEMSVQQFLVRMGVCENEEKKWVFSNFLWEWVFVRMRKRSGCSAISCENGCLWEWGKEMGVQQFLVRMGVCENEEKKWVFSNFLWEWVFVRMRKRSGYSAISCENGCLWEWGKEMGVQQFLVRMGVCENEEKKWVFSNFLWEWVFVRMRKRNGCSAISCELISCRIKTNVFRSCKFHEVSKLQEICMEHPMGPN